MSKTKKILIVTLLVDVFLLSVAINAFAQSNIGISFNKTVTISNEISFDKNYLQKSKLTEVGQNLLDLLGENGNYVSQSTRVIDGNTTGVYPQGVAVSSVKLSGKIENRGNNEVRFIMAVGNVFDFQEDLEMGLVAEGAIGPHDILDINELLVRGAQNNLKEAMFQGFYDGQVEIQIIVLSDAGKPMTKMTNLKIETEISYDR